MVGIQDAVTAPTDLSRDWHALGSTDNTLWLPVCTGLNVGVAIITGLNARLNAPVTASGRSIPTVKKGS